MYALPSVSESNWIQGTHGFQNPRIFKAICLSREIKGAPCLIKIQFFGGENGVTFPARRLGRWYMKDVRSPDYMPPSRFLGRADKIQSNTRYYIWGRLNCRSCRKAIRVDSQPPCDSVAPNHDIRRRMTSPSPTDFTRSKPFL